MNLRDVEFAPLCVPFRRRLETLAAAAWIYLVVLGGLTGWAVLLYILTATRFWWLSVLYLSWIYLDRSVGSSNKIRCVQVGENRRSAARENRGRGNGHVRGERNRYSGGR